MGETIDAACRQDTQSSYCRSSELLARYEFDSLEKWLYSLQAHSLPLRGVEVAEQRRGRELLRLLLQAHVESRGDGDVGAAIRVHEPDSPDGHLIYTHKHEHARHLITIFGEIHMKRIGYSMEGRRSIHPLDEQLQLPGRKYSYEIQRLVVKKAVQGPFDEAVDAVYEATGVIIPKRSAEKIVIDGSVDFYSFYARRRGPAGERGGSILVGSIDCKGIPMVKSELTVKTSRRGKGQKAQKKKMATVAAVFTQEPYIRTPEEVVQSLFPTAEVQSRSRHKSSGPQRKRVWASLQASKDWFISDVKKEMARRDPRGRKSRVVVTDGERALQRRASLMINDAVFVLDLLHVLERLWAAGHALYGEGTDKAVQFVRRRALRILSGEVSQVVKGFRQIVTKRQLKGKKAEALLGAAAYYYRNKSRMRYNEYLTHGLPIASGSVEGACKNLIKDRMERSGMRWSSDGAEAMVKMRAAYLSRDFEEYWDWHIAQEQERLYPKARWEPTITVVLK